VGLQFYAEITKLMGLVGNLMPNSLGKSHVIVLFCELDHSSSSTAVAAVLSMSSGYLSSSFIYGFLERENNA